MRNHLKHYILFFALALAFSLAGCVSVKLGTGAVKKSEDIKFKDVESPFKNITSTHEKMDRAWQSSKTGNTIGFISECGGPTTPLATLENDVLSNVESLKIVSTERKLFNERESLNTWASGQVDGIPIQIKSVIFRKGECSYTITYMGRSKHFENEIAQFDKFLDGFVAP